MLKWYIRRDFLCIPGPVDLQSSVSDRGYGADMVLKPMREGGLEYEAVQK